MTGQQKTITPGLGTVLILLAGCSWGSIGIFVRTFGREALGSMEIVALRSIFTAVFMALFLLIYDRKLLRIRLKDLWCFIGTGVVSMAFFNFCYFRLITVSSLSVATVMLYTAPAFVMGLSALLFKEKITKMMIFAVVLTVVGCAFVTGILGSPVKLSLEAILLGLGAGVGYALYSIFSRYALLRGYHNFTIVLYTFIFTAAAVIPLSDMGKLASVVTKSPGMAGFSALCGIVTTVFPYIVYNFGCRVACLRLLGEGGHRRLGGAGRGDADRGFHFQGDHDGGESRRHLHGARRDRAGESQGEAKPLLTKSELMLC